MWLEDVPYAFVKRTTYENFIAECPGCGNENIFNRASDLKAFKPIAFRRVACSYCGADFNINNDTVNPPHQMLLFECREMFNQKRYMHTVLSVAQAYEVFSGLYARAELLYKPFAKDGGCGIVRLNQLSKHLFDRIGKWSFDKMRSLVLWHLHTFEQPHDNMDEAEDVIMNLPTQPPEPKKVQLQRFRDEDLRFFALGLKGTTVNSLRNKVVHMRAYRPTAEETQRVLEEAETLLHPAAFLLRLYDDINVYPVKSDKLISRAKC